MQDSDDPAAANWGSEWSTPSKAQWEELLDNTTSQWMIQNGVNGRLFTSEKNGQTIFLPAYGYRSDYDFCNASSGGYYWSSSLRASDPYYAWYFYFNSDYCDVSDLERYYGFSVRPVRSARQN